MFSRRALMKVMLWSLAIGAGAGVMGALLGSYEVVFRVMWSAFSAAIAAGFLMYMSRLVDRRWTRPAGLFGMTAALTVFAIALGGIWRIDRLSGWIEVWQIAATAAWLAALTLPAIVLLCLTQTDGSRHAGLVGVVTAAVTFLLGIVAIYYPRTPTQWYLSHIQEHLWGTAGVLGGYGVLVVGCLGESARHQRPWRWIGVAAAAAGLAIGVYLVWWSYARPGDVPLKVLTVLTSVACVAMFANLLLLLPLRSAPRWLAPATIGAGLVTAVLIDLLVLYEIGEVDSPVARLAGAAGVLTICGALALLVLAAMNRGIQLDPGSFIPVDVTMICPRCRKKQKLAIGESACTACGLRICVSVEEPRCPHCEYLLYGLTSDACPECGRPIRGPARGAEKAETIADNRA